MRDDSGHYTADMAYDDDDDGIEYAGGSADRETAMPLAGRHETG